MATPRKFSEKIALQKMKQAEETAAFEQIMREVSDATARVNKNAKLAPALGNFRGGSLPNVNNDKTKEKPNDETSPIREPYPDETGGSSPARETGRQSRGRTAPGPVRSRTNSRNIDTSPYGSGNVAYLSPPSDSSWRRTSSDSAIHQSLSQNQDNNHLTTHSHLTLSPSMQRRRNAQMTNNLHVNHGNHSTQDLRSRSAPRVPAINIPTSYPHPDSIPIPSINNTGSLPDLTLVNSYPTSIYSENTDQTNMNQYSTSPLGTSPISLSPIAAMANNRTNFNYPNANNSNNNINNNNSNIKNQNNSSQPNFLSVPDNRFTFSKGGNSFDSHRQRLNSIDQTYDLINSQLNDSLSSPNQQNSPDIYGSHGNITQPSMPVSSGYRSPHNRPSPGSSPSLVQMPNTFDSNSSAPCSPVPHNLGSNGQSCEKYMNDTYYQNQDQTQMLNNFELFSLNDNRMYTPTANTATYKQDYQFDPSPYPPLSPSPNPSLENDLRNSHSPNLDHNSLANSFINQSILSCPNGEPLLCSQSSAQMLNNAVQQRLYNNATQSPQIPEIVFTDFSSSTSDLTKGNSFVDEFRPFPN